MEIIHPPRYSSMSSRASMNLAEEHAPVLRSNPSTKGSRHRFRTKPLGKERKEKENRDSFDISKEIWFCLPLCHRWHTYISITNIELSCKALVFFEATHDCCSPKKYTKALSGVASGCIHGGTARTCRIMPKCHIAMATNQRARQINAIENHSQEIFKPGTAKTVLCV